MRRKLLDTAHLRRLVGANWNPAFGEATSDGVETWLQALEAGYDADVASGTRADDAVTRVEALVVVMGQLTEEQIAGALSLADARK